MGYLFPFSSLYPATYIELYLHKPIQISHLNFKAVLALPKTAHSAQTHKSITFIWIFWGTLYVYLWLTPWSRKSVWKTYSRMKNYPLLFPPFLTAWLWNTGEFVIYVYLLFPLNWTVWGCHSVALKLKVGFESWNMSLNYNCRIKNNSRFFTFSCLS